MLNKLTKRAIIALGAALVVVMLTFLLRDTSRIINWRSSGFALSSIAIVEDSTTWFWRADSGDFITSPHPVDGDTLVAIDDVTASLQRWIDVLETPHEPGKEVTVTYLHGGRQYETTIKTRPVRQAHFFVVVILQILR
ncbi:MAG: hypothetical protein ABH878_02530, partial [bacterium]